MKFTARLVASLLLLATAAGAQAQLFGNGPVLKSMAEFKSGKFQFESIKNQVWWYKVNEGRYSLATADRVQVPAVLFMPDNVTGRVPAVVIIHGIGGAYTRDGNKRPYWDYAEELAKSGVAAVMVDTHGGRGVGVTDMLSASQIPVFAFTADAFAVRDLLKTHPAIDPDKIGVVGFSKGGAAAFLATDERAAKALSADGSAFALHVGIYPGCHAYPEAPRVQKTQVLMILGDRDNYTGTSSCKEIAAKLEGTAAKAQVVILENATHSWDERVTRLHIQDVSSEDCRWRLQDDCRELTPDNRQVVGRAAHGGQVAAADYWRSCTKQLPNIYIENNAKATRDSRRLVVEAAKAM